MLPLTAQTQPRVDARHRQLPAPLLHSRQAWPDLLRPPSPPHLAAAAAAAALPPAAPPAPGGVSSSRALLSSSNFSRPAANIRLITVRGEDGLPWPAALRRPPKRRSWIDGGERGVEKWTLGTTRNYVVDPAPAPAPIHRPESSSVLGTSSTHCFAALASAKDGPDTPWGHVAHVEGTVIVVAGVAGAQAERLNCAGTYASTSGERGLIESGGWGSPGRPVRRWERFTVGVDVREYARVNWTVARRRGTIRTRQGRC